MDRNDKPTAKELSDMVESLYEDYRDYLTDYAQSSGFSPEVSQDLMQEVFVIALQKPTDLFFAVSRKGWLIRTLKNLMWNHQRKVLYVQKLQTILERKYRPGQLELSNSTVYKGMIPDDDLELLIRYWVRCEKVENIAEDLVISVDACRKRLQRAKNRFKKAYEEQFGRLE